MTTPEDRPERERFLDRPENVRKVLRILYVVCGFLMLLDFADVVLQRLHIIHLRHAYRVWEGLPGFYSVFGFVACVTLVLIAKQMRRVLKRGEEYYDR
jgi:hypothetical protein